MAARDVSDSVVSDECIKELIDFYSRGSYKAKNVDRRNEIVHKMCIHLLARDYDVEVIDNKAGQLCGHYPSELLAIERQKMSSSTRQFNPRAVVNDTALLKELITSARFARCRSRFVMPVILFEDKNICRSATLSTMAEMYGRAGMDWFTGGETGNGGRDRPSSSLVQPSTASGSHTTTDKDESELMTRVRGQDVQLLKAVGVDLICDLMVEKKKIKYGLLVASSEKVDKWARYCDFQIASMPYPGCEFFQDYKEKGFNPVDLHFDWSQSMIDADLLIPESLERMTHIPFKNYQDWDLVQITMNYLKLFLTYIQHGKGGLLIHCISGWDRTPLFICLLRLSLWADGRAHNSLSPREILYFTLAYDWFTFGHPFKDRRDKGEEILYFCYDFLQYMTSDALSVNRTTQDHTLTGTSGSCSCTNSTTAFTSAVASLSITEPYTTHDNWSYSPHPQSHSQSTSYSPSPSPSPSVRHDRLLTVRTLFQRAYRTALPAEVQSQGAMAFATGLLSKLPIFGT